MTQIASVAILIFWANVGLLAYIYWAYGAILRILVRLIRGRDHKFGFHDGAWPAVTALLTVHNEGCQIEGRLINLSEQIYPGEIEILVCSDGSDDRTDELASKFHGPRSVRLLQTARLGKSGAQNIAMREAKGEIVVLTDAETRFDAKCIYEMVSAFAEETVGCITANLRFRNYAGAIAKNQGFYWKYELALRDLESRLGILAVTSGQAMAFRRKLFRELPPFAGDDCIIPLDVVDQGYKVIHCPSAVAHDNTERRAVRELRSRIRMTARNWTGMWLYPTLLNPVSKPGYALALWSHKLLRWLASSCLIWLPCGALAMFVTSTQTLTAYFFATFAAIAGIGWWADRNEKSIPIAGTVYSFCLANLGFLLGVIRAILGHRITSYRLDGGLR